LGFPKTGPATAGRLGRKYAANLCASLLVFLTVLTLLSTTGDKAVAQISYSALRIPHSAFAQPYAGDPMAERPRPGTPAPYTLYFTETGHYLGGAFLDFYNSIPNSAYIFGLPISEQFPQEFADGTILRVQYFERARFEWHPELPEGQRMQLGSLSSIVLKGRTFDRVPEVASSDSLVYFPETGHTLANGFLGYWQANGGLAIFGFPISEEMVEGGVTVQYFERARFEYYSGLEGTPYAVQLSPLGYIALRAFGFNLPMGIMADFNPPIVAEGHTDMLTVGAPSGVTVTGEYEGRPLLFTQAPDQGIAWTLIGAVPFADLGPHQVTVDLQNGDGGKSTITRTLQVVSYPFPSESLQFDPQTAQLLDPTHETPETDFLDKIFSGRTPVQYWSGQFRMPLDGQVRITSAFATRRCYNCPDGSAPTTYHGGMDMAADEGTPVHAPADGVVVFAGKLEVRGNAVIIDHGLGVYSLLAHNSKLLVTVGQKVKKGDVISLSGSTGLSTGPHLHWEVHVSGPAVEPLEWVNRALP
jgi:hypothetical protein